MWSASKEYKTCILKAPGSANSTNKAPVHINLNLVLATCGEDKRLGFLDASGKIAHKIKKAHESPINRIHFANGNTLISGDDDGIVKVWDLRSS